MTQRALDQYNKVREALRLYEVAKDNATDAKLEVYKQRGILEQIRHLDSWTEAQIDKMTIGEKGVVEDICS